MRTLFIPFLELVLWWYLMWVFFVGFLLCISFILCISYAVASWIVELWCSVAYISVCLGSFSLNWALALSIVWWVTNVILLLFLRPVSDLFFSDFWLVTLMKAYALQQVYVFFKNFFHELATPIRAYCFDNLLPFLPSYFFIQGNGWKNHSRPVQDIGL